jgi:hypothetical protein
MAAIMLGTNGVIKSMSTTLVKEIGWRGFFIHESRKVLSFSGVCIFSSIILAAWNVIIILA